MKWLTLILATLAFGYLSLRLSPRPVRRYARAWGVARTAGRVRFVVQIRVGVLV